MDQLQRMIEKARGSSFYLGLLNYGLWARIPFNKPHRFRISRITDNGFEITMPYRRKNMNHLRGLHACGLATLTEYVAGLTLLRKVGSKRYRLIMETLTMKYHYQAKMAVTARFELDDAWVQTQVIQPLQNQDAVFVDLTVEIYDGGQNHICTGTTRWQLKDWSKVKTNV